VAVRAVIFDFNGTLSNDEPILCEIFRRLFAEHGKPLSVEEYYDRLAGHSDPEIVRMWLGADDPDIDKVIAQRTAFYVAAVADGSSISEDVRAAVRFAAARVPVGIVSGAARAEIEPVLEAADLAGAVKVIVSVDDVGAGKPDPESYLRALELLGDGLDARDVVVLEDTDAGIAAAKAAGMRCIAVLGTLEPERLAAADEIVAELDTALMERVLG
jgi:HAD superfamily hydrolase (TIGR01509 family)